MIMVAGTEEGALDDLQTYIDLENDKLNDVLGSLFSNSRGCRLACIAYAS